MSDLLISVIIPTHRRLKLLKDLVGSLEQQSLFPVTEVLVVANLPEPETEKFVLERGLNFKYFSVGAIGVNKARNFGIENASGKILIFLDDDCFLSDSNYLKKIWTLHSENPQSSAIGGVYTLSGVRNPASEAYHWIAEHWLWNSLEEGHRTRNLIGGNCSFKKNSLGDLRFNEDIVFGGAETELFQRMYNLNQILLFFPQLQVEHRLFLNYRGFLRKSYLQGWSAGVRAKGVTAIAEEKTPRINLSKHVSLQNGKLTLRLLFYFFVYDYVFSLGRIRQKSPSWLYLALSAFLTSLGKMLSEIVSTTFKDIYGALGLLVKDHDSIR